MELELAKCILRNWRPSDAVSLQKSADDPRVAAFLRDAFPHPYTMADAEKWIANNLHNDTQLAVEVEGAAAGGIGIIPGVDIHRCEAELGYWLAPSFWGRGIMTDAAREFSTRILDSPDRQRLFARVFAGNPASARVLEKAGFFLESRQRNSWIKEGRIGDIMLFARVKTDSGGATETVGGCPEDAGGVLMRPIGYIKTPFTELDSTPRQPVKGESPVCTVVVKEEYMEALEGIEQFERIWLVFLFHRAGGYKKKVRARLDGELKGLFATRAPWRPNPIGISSLKLVSREGNILKVTGADLFDGTPILDIKPYLPE